MLQSKNLADKDGKPAPSYKRREKRVTVLLCALYSIWRPQTKTFAHRKSQNPKAFKSMNMDILPIKYKNQKKFLDGLLNFQNEIFW